MVPVRILDHLCGCVTVCDCVDMLLTVSPLWLVQWLVMFVLLDSNLGISTYCLWFVTLVV